MNEYDPDFGWRQWVFMICVVVVVGAPIVAWWSMAAYWIVERLR